MKIKYQEQAEIQGGRLEITPEELDAIKAANPQAKDLEAENVYAFECTAINTNCTSNGRVYSKEWQEAALDKWAGTPLVFSQDDHQPSAPDVYGWVYNARLEEGEDGAVSTITKVAVPLIEDTEPLIDRLNAGLNRGVSLSAEISKDSVTEGQDGTALIGADPDTRLLHLAVVANGACRECTIRRTSESIRFDETAKPEPVQPVKPDLDPEAKMLLEEARAARLPVIKRCCRISRLLTPNQDPKIVQERFSKWSLTELVHYAESQEQVYKVKHPTATKQQSVTSETEERASEPKSITEILQTLR